jgi:hypothetical protein
MQALRLRDSSLNIEQGVISQAPAVRLLDWCFGRCSLYRTVGECITCAYSLSMLNTMTEMMMRRYMSVKPTRYM